MKIILFGIVMICGIVGLATIWYFANYDPTPMTTENIFGVTALVIHRPVGIGCPTVNCHFPDYYLKINTKSKTFLLGYNICDVNSCTKQDNIAISLPVARSIPPEYQELPLPDNLPWKDGDPVSIQVKIATTFILDSGTSFDSDHASKTWIDLGKSEIVRSS